MPHICTTNPCQICGDIFAGDDDEDNAIKHCSNTKCINTFRTIDGHEMGTSSGYADDYSFCDTCFSIATKHFDIACYHDGGMVTAPGCEGRDKTNPPIPHTCHFSEEERNEAKLAFRHYR